MLWTGALRIKARDNVMAGLNARGMVQPKITIYMYSGLGYSSYHIGEPSLISKLLLPCVYDTIYDYAVLLLISLLINYIIIYMH